MTQTHPLIPVNTSTSQTQTANSCLRKWAIDKVFKIRQPQTRATRLGGCVHEQVECYENGEPLWAEGWSKGLSTAEVLWAQRVLPYAIAEGIITEANEYTDIELPICMLVGARDTFGMPILAEAVVKVIDGIRVIQRPQRYLNGETLSIEHMQCTYYVGFIDRFESRIGSALVIDHKTAKNTKYAKTPKKLKADLQVNNYALFALARDYKLGEATVRHNIFIKEPQAGESLVYTVEATITRADALRHWDELEAKNAQMLEIRNRHSIQTEHKSSPDRGARFVEIPGVIDSGDKKLIKDGCDAYSGCPYRDACKGLCTIQQLTARLDGGASIPETKQAASTPPPLNLQQQPQEKEMVFESITSVEAAPIEPFQYMTDPASGASFRCIILKDNGATLQVGVYPFPNVAPDWASIPDCYVYEMPAASVMQSTTAMDLGSYQSVLDSAQVAGASDWTPATAQTVNTFAQPAPTAGTQAAADLHQAAADPQQTSSPLQHSPSAPDKEQEAAPPLTLPVSAPDFLPAIGIAVQVKNNTDAFWGERSGKFGIITGVSPDGLVDVDIAGDPYPAVQSGRFDKVDYDPHTLTGSPQNDAAILVNQLVHLELTNTESPYRGVLSGTDPQGIVVLGVQYGWDQIQKLSPMTEEPTPGNDKEAEEIATNKEEKSATYMEVTGKIRDIVAAVQAKKSPTMPKKQQEELLHFLDVLECKDEPERQADVGDAVDVDAKIVEAYQRGLNDMQSEANACMDRFNTP